MHGHFDFQWLEQVLSCMFSALWLASGLNKCLHVSQLISLSRYSKTLSLSLSFLGPCNAVSREVVNCKIYFGNGGQWSTWIEINTRSVVNIMEMVNLEVLLDKV